MVRLWKLALYEAHETSDVTAVVNKQLGQHHTVDELIATQLEATIEKIKKILAQPKSFSNPSTASTREIDDEVVRTSLGLIIPLARTITDFFALLCYRK